MATPVDGLRGDESGFSLIESIIALTIAAMVVSGAGLMLGQGLKGTLLARQNEQVAELLSAEIEAIRGLDHAAIAMVPADLVGDPAVIPGTPPSVDHDGGSIQLGPEPIATSATGAVSPHIRTVVHNETPYAITRYVSDVVDTAVTPPARLKRVTVIARWQSGDTARERSSSTLVTRTRRGLPLPEFTFGDPVTKVVAPLGELVLPVTLHNNGARDSWDLSVTAIPALASTWSWYLDRSPAVAPSLEKGPADGVFDVADDVLLGTSSGPLEVDTSKVLLAVYSAPVPLATPTYSVSLTARSVGQPAAVDGTKTVVDTVQVRAPGPPSCLTCVSETYHLHNELPLCATSCTSNVKDPLLLDLAAPVATGLGDFDRNQDPVDAPGRRLRDGGAGVTENDNLRMIRWSRSLPSQTTVAVGATVRLYVAPVATGADGAVVLTTYVVRRSGNGSGAATILGQTSTVLTGLAAGSFTPVDVTVAFGGETTLAANDRIEVRSVLTTGIGSTDVVSVAYGTAATPASLSYWVKP